MTNPRLPAWRAGLMAVAASALSLPAVAAAPLSAPQDPESASAAATVEAKKAEPETVAKIRLSGTYADLAEAAPDMTAALLGGGGAPPKPFYELIDGLRAFAADEDGPRTLVFDLSTTPGFNMAQHAEFARAFGELRDAGHKTVAYIEGGGSGTLRLACLCDEIAMADMGALEFGSMGLEVAFMKDALDLLGVQMDVVRCGDFKGAVEPYMRSSMSDHLRAHYLDMLGHINAELVEAVAARRGLSIDKVRALQAERMLTAERALEAGLVDRLVPWAGAKAAYARVRGDENFEFRDAIRKADKKKDVNPLVFLGNLLNGRKKEEVTEAWGIAVLHLSGGIVDGNDRAPGSIVSKPTVRAIESLRDNDDVQGVVVRINSPGGSATASEAILLALQDLAEVKPVVCSMGRVAASGGYYVTCFGAPILAERGTITGSIGVFGMKPNAGALMRRVGVNLELVALDESAGMNSLMRGWSDEEHARIQGFVDDVYDRFLGHVAGSRKMAVADVAAIAGGRVWSGDQAVKLGLVDRIGGLDAAIAMVAEAAGIGDKDYQISHVPEPADFLESLLGGLAAVRADLVADPARAAMARPVLASFGALSGAWQMLEQSLRNPGRMQVWALAPVVKLR